MEKDHKAILFVALAVVSLLFLLISGPLYVVENLAFLMVQIFGIILIIWAFIAKKVNRQHSHHKLPSGYFFVNKGPYEIIRHPIYAGLLLLVLSLLEYNFVFLRLAAFVIFLIALLLKIIREEYTMEQKIPEYEEYKKQTKCLIPYLF